MNGSYFVRHLYCTRTSTRSFYSHLCCFGGLLLFSNNTSSVMIANTTNFLLYLACTVLSVLLLSHTHQSSTNLSTGGGKPFQLSIFFGIAFLSTLTVHLLFNNITNPDNNNSKWEMMEITMASQVFSFTCLLSILRQHGFYDLVDLRGKRVSSMLLVSWLHWQL